MRSEFSVVLDGPVTGPQVLTRGVSNLKFKTAQLGGYVSASFDLARDLAAEDFEKFSNISIFDTETGVQVGGGRLLIPGKAISAAGEVWEVSAVGEGLAALQERAQPYVLYDRRYDAWYQAFQSTKNAAWSVSDVPSGTTDGVLVTLSEAIANGRRSDVRHYDLHETEQKLAAFKGDFVAGHGDTGSKVVAYASNYSTTSFVIINGATGQSFSTSIQSFDGVVGTDWVYATLNPDNVFIRYERTGATIAAAADNDWAHLRNLEVWAIRLGRDRLPITDPNEYNGFSMGMTQAIIDVLARFCPTIDVANASIDTGTFDNLGISSASWMQGITPAGVFDEIMNTSYDQSTWQVWEKQTNGLFRFEWRPLPDYRTVRYECPGPVEFQRSGAEDEAYNEYWVTGSNSKGRAITSPQRFWFPADTATPGFRVRSKAVDLGQSSNFGTDAAWLADAHHSDDAYLATSARLLLAAPIYDRETGRWVKPYEVQPGHNIQIFGVRGEVDILNFDPDSESRVFRIDSNEYSADAGTSLLELNGGTSDQLRMLASLTAMDPAARR